MIFKLHNQFCKFSFESDKTYCTLYTIACRANPQFRCDFIHSLAKVSFILINSFNPIMKYDFLFFLFWNANNFGEREGMLLLIPTTTTRFVVVKLDIFCIIAKWVLDFRISTMKWNLLQQMTLSWSYFRISAWKLEETSMCVCVFSCWKSEESHLPMNITS